MRGLLLAPGEVKIALPLYVPVMGFEEMAMERIGPDISRRLSGSKVSEGQYGYVPEIQAESDAAVAGTSTGYGEPSLNTQEAL